MKKKYSILAVLLPAVVAVILLGATTPQSPAATASSFKSDSNQITKDSTDEIVKNVDDLAPSFSGAFAQVPLDQIDALKAQGRQVVEVNLVAKAVDLPIMGGGTYHALT